MKHSKRVFWYAIFVIVSVVSIWVPLYNRLQPAWLGIPFFYWFQFLLVIVSALVTALAWRARV
ncbi:MAG: DUF3311 domain-containing protein [Rhodanobacteraceae bacterium]